MNTTDRAPLIAIAMLAARADGRTDSAEQAAVDAVVAKMGSPDVSGLAEQVAGGSLRVTDLAAKLSDDEARHTAYNGALAICNADGPANAAEQAFLDELRRALGIEVEPVAEVHTGTPPAGPLDGFILPGDVKRLMVIRIPRAYPVYHKNYALHLKRLLGYIEGCKNITTLGRTGEFMYMDADRCMRRAFDLADSLSQDLQKERIRVCV